MADRVAQLHVELAELIARHEPTLTDRERFELLHTEQHGGWRPRSRPTRAEPKVSAFLNLSDRAEQEELTDRTLAAGTIDEPDASSANG